MARTPALACKFAATLLLAGSGLSHASDMVRPTRSRTLAVESSQALVKAAAVPVAAAPVTSPKGKTYGAQDIEWALKDAQLAKDYQRQPAAETQDILDFKQLKDAADARAAAGPAITSPRGKVYKDADIRWAQAAANNAKEFNRAPTDDVQDILDFKQLKDAADAKAALAPTSAAITVRSPKGKTYSENEIKWALAEETNATDYKRTPSDEVKDILAYAQSIKDAAAQVKDATAAATGGCNGAKDPNNDPCNRLGAGAIPEVGMNTAGESTTASLKLMRYYLSIGDDNYFPVWLGTTLPANGPVKRDGVVQAILNNDAGLVNFSFTPWLTKDGDYLYRFNKSKTGLCGFGSESTSGCFGFLRAGLKIIQAPVSETSGDYARPLMGYLTAGALLTFPIYSKADNSDPTVGSLSMGLGATMAALQAKKLDFVFGRRIKNHLGTINADVSFKITDVISLAASAVLYDSEKTIGRNHSVSLNFATK